MVESNGVVGSKFFVSFLILVVIFLKSVQCNDCNGNGQFQNNTCICYSNWDPAKNCSVCLPNYTGNNCSIPICFGKLANDSDVCSGHGKCESPDRCVCTRPSHYFGSRCDKSEYNYY